MLGGLPSFPSYGDVPPTQFISGVDGLPFIVCPGATHRIDGLRCCEYIVKPAQKSTSNPVATAVKPIIYSERREPGLILVTTLGS